MITFPVLSPLGRPAKSTIAFVFFVKHKTNGINMSQTRGKDNMSIHEAERK